MEDFVLRPKEVIFMKNKKIRKAAKKLHLRIDFENHKMAEAFYKKIRKFDWRTQLETGEEVVLKLGPVTKPYVEIKGNGKTAKMMIKEVFEDMYE